MIRRFFFWPIIACVFATLLVLQPYIRGYVQKATERTEKVERIENRAAIAAALPHGLKLDDGIPFASFNGEEWRPGKKTVEQTLIEIGASLGPTNVLQDSAGLEVVFVESFTPGVNPNKGVIIKDLLRPEPKANQRAIVFKQTTEQ